MHCDVFQSTLQADDRRLEILEHLRSCENCLEYAVQIDPDVLFRSLGGEEMVPPGGVDAFAADVMQQVYLRQKESSLSARRVVPFRRWAAAAALASVLAGSSYFIAHQRRTTAASPVGGSVAMSQHRPAPIEAPRPVIESYDSNNATIVEVPSEGASDVKVVMIFDDSLPADL